MRVVAACCITGYMSSLRSIPAFGGLDAGVLAAVARDSRPVCFDAGAVLRRAGQSADAVVLLLAGTVVASFLARSGAQMWPARWTGPAIVDKPAVLTGRAGSTSLVAATAGEARLLPRPRFLQLLADQPSVGRHVLGHLADDVLEQRRLLVAALTLPASGRVAGWLLATAVADPVADPIAWRGSQQQLGHLLGLSRVTVNRALRTLTRAGAVQQTPRGIRVLDRTLLASFVSPQ